MQIERQDFNKVCTLAGNAILPRGGKRGSVRKSNNGESILGDSSLQRRRLIQSDPTADKKPGNNLLRFYCLFCLNVRQAICARKTWTHPSWLVSALLITLLPIHINRCRSIEQTLPNFVKIRNLNLMLYMDQSFYPIPHLLCNNFYCTSYNNGDAFYRNLCSAHPSSQSLDDTCDGRPAFINHACHIHVSFDG